MRNYLAAFIILLASFQQTIPAHTGATAASGGGSSQTVVQHPHNFTCGGTAASNTVTCTVTATATTPGNLVIMAGAMFTGTGPSVTGDSASGDTFTSCGTGVSGGGANAAACQYTLSAAGGATSLGISFTATGLSGNTYAIDAELVEVHKPSGPWTLDGYGTQFSTCSTCTDSAPTGMTGSNDFILRFGAFNDSTLTGPGSPYTNPSDIETTNVNGGFIGALDQTTGGTINWTQGGSSAASMITVAFK